MIRYNIFAFYILLILLVTGLLYLYSRSYFGEGSNTMFVVAENRTVLRVARLSILTPSGGTVRGGGDKMVYHIDNETFTMAGNVSILWDSTLALTPSTSTTSPRGNATSTPPPSYRLRTDTLDYGEDKVFYLPQGGDITIRRGGLSFEASASSLQGDLNIRIKPGLLVFDPQSNTISSDDAKLLITSDNFTLHSIDTAHVMYTLGTGDMVVDGMSEVREVATGNTLVSDRIMFNSHNSTIKFLGNVSIKVQESSKLR